MAEAKRISTRPIRSHKQTESDSRRSQETPDELGLLLTGEMMDDEGLVCVDLEVLAIGTACDELLGIGLGSDEDQG